MDKMTRRLEYYLGGRGVFDHGRAHRPPRLRSNRTNCVLFYPSFFNPPHIGHLALLQHVRSNSAEDLDIIAGVVFPLDDGALVRRVGPSNDDIKLHKNERVRLWRVNVPADIFWIYEESASDWREFQDNFLRNTARDGFEVRISLLCGPDRIKEMEILPIEPMGCKEILLAMLGETL